MAYNKPLPDRSQALTKPFWDGLVEHRVVLQRCVSCAHLRWPIAAVCPECLSRDTEWQEIPAEGELWSYNVYHRAFAPGFADDIPYAVGLVVLDSGPNIIARLEGEPADARVGARVRATFDDVTDDVTLLRWVQQ